MAKNRNMALKFAKAKRQRMGNFAVIDAAVAKCVFSTVTPHTAPKNTPIIQCKAKTNNCSYWSKAR